MLKWTLGKIASFRMNREYKRSLARNNQERLDTMRMFWWTQFYNNYKKRVKENPAYRNKPDLTPLEIEEMSDSVRGDKLPLMEVRNQVYLNLDEQINTIFGHICAIGGLNPYPKPVYRIGEKRYEYDEVTDAAIENELKKQFLYKEIEVYNPGAELPHPDGFSLVIKKSAIDHPAAGYGVHVKGEILPGTVIGFYPGTVYFPQDISEAVVTENEYLIGRYDGVVIDGRMWDRRAEQLHREIRNLQVASGITPELNSLNKFRNPYALANYINHPPREHLKRVNAFLYQYDFPADMPEEFKQYIPNEYFKPPNVLWARDDVTMFGMVCVARRRIKDEELFINYRLNPANPYPDWYAQPDPNEATRRWGKLKRWWRPPRWA